MVSARLRRARNYGIKTMNETKDITFGKDTYQMGKFSARDGAWVLGHTAGRGVLNAVFNNISGSSNEPIEKATALALIYAFQDMSEEVCQGMQTRCYAVCKHYEQHTDKQVAMPLLKLDGSGRWLEGQEPESMIAFNLVIATLIFNLESFFAPGARKMLAQIYPEAMLSRDKTDKAPSTDISSAP